MFHLKKMRRHTDLLKIEVYVKLCDVKLEILIGADAKKIIISYKNVFLYEFTVKEEDVYKVIDCINNEYIGYIKLEF